mgnify:CR=1 FL=1
MSLSNKKKTQSTSDIFDDDFEVIYEGDLPDISIDDDDDYRDYRILIIQITSKKMITTD